MKARIDAESFKNVIDNTKKFRCTYRDMMRYIYLEINAETKELKATALDGHKVSVAYVPCMEVDESFKCFILPAIPKISKKDRYVELELVERRAFITVNQNIMGYIQPEGDFWNIDNLLKEAQNEATVTASIYVDAKLLKDALDSCKGNYKDWVKIEIRDKKDPIVITQRHSKNVKLVLPINAGEG